MRDPAVVRTPLVTRTSLSASGTPASGPSRSPRARASSTARACSSACSPMTVRKACSTSSVAWIRTRAASVAATAVASPLAKRHALGRQPLDLLGLFEDVGELTLEAVQLFVGEGETGQAGDVLHVGTADRHGTPQYSKRAGRNGIGAHSPSARSESTQTARQAAAHYPQPAWTVAADPS